MNNNKPINYTKLLLASAVGTGFICLGIHLVKTQTTIGLVIGYANILFWTAMFIFAIYKIIKINLQK